MAPLQSRFFKVKNIVMKHKNHSFIANDLKMIGGGSFKKRLGEAFIQCFNYDTKKLRIFLGTSDGEVYIYDLIED